MCVTTFFVGVLAGVALGLVIAFVGDPERIRRKAAKRLVISIRLDGHGVGFEDDDER